MYKEDWTQNTDLPGDGKEKPITLFKRMSARSLLIMTENWSEVYQGIIGDRAPVTLVWGYNTTTGLKELAIQKDSVGDALDEVQLRVDDFNNIYSVWSKNFGCEASFDLVYDKNKNLQQIRVAAINMPVYRCEDSTGDKVKKMMEDAKKEHE